jgi:hypothetical protein
MNFNRKGYVRCFKDTAEVYKLCRFWFHPDAENRNLEVLKDTE